MNLLNIYVHFPTKDKSFGAETEWETIWEEMSLLIQRITCEKEAQLYYHTQNKAASIELLQIMEDLHGQFGTMDCEALIDKLLYDAEAKSCDTDLTDFHGIWDLDSRQMKHLEADTVLNAMAAHAQTKKSVKQEKFLLLNLRRDFEWYRGDNITIFQDNHNQTMPMLIHLPYCIDFQSLEDWIEKNRFPRNYNYNDNRHIKGHAGYIKGKSPLLDGIAGKPNAAELLKTAIGYKNIKDLVNIDKKHQRYIWFEDQNVNPQNEYHGYHLTNPESYERDFKKEREGKAKIPECVKAVLKYRLELKSIDFDFKW